MAEPTKYENWELMQLYANYYVDLIGLIENGEFNLVYVKDILNAMEWCVDESNRKRV